MFLGASLNPDYFKEKINLFIALAPVANTSYVTAPLGKVFAPYISLIQHSMVGVLHMYNWFDSADKKYLLNICNHRLAAPLCQKFLYGHFFNTKVDNLERVPVFMYNEPSGQSWRTFVYYAQMMNSGRYALYDYGKRKNN